MTYATSLYSAHDPEFLENCARNIEDEFPHFASGLRMMAGKQREGAQERASKQLPADNIDWTERN